MEYICSRTTGTDFHFLYVLKATFNLEKTSTMFRFLYFLKATFDLGKHGHKVVLRKHV